jgi:hypothetical protein
MPVVLFLLWFASSPGFRQFILSLSPRAVTLVQSVRVAGIVFLALGTYKILPEYFALSAGWGDIIIGATAPFAALSLASPAHRKGFIFWQLLGIADLVNALALGTLSGVIDPHGIPTAAMAVLPMSYITTFTVPVFFILHIIGIAQARALAGDCFCCNRHWVLRCWRLTMTVEPMATPFGFHRGAKRREFSVQYCRG